MLMLASLGLMQMKRNRFKGLPFLVSCKSSYTGVFWQQIQGITEQVG